MTPMLLVLALAQPPADKPAPNPAAELTEDVEVMRVLLTRAVGGGWATDVNAVYGYRTDADPSRAVLANTLNALNTFPQAPAAKFDGLALKGYGAVFTLSFNAVGPDPGVPGRSGALLETCQKCHELKPANAAKIAAAEPKAARGEWDQARDELRGGGRPAAPETVLTTSDVCYPGRLAESLIKSLAKNGRHLRHLKPDELVTVSVSNDAYGSPAAANPTADTGAYRTGSYYVPYTKDGVTHYRLQHSYTPAPGGSPGGEGLPSAVPTIELNLGRRAADEQPGGGLQVTPSTPPGGGLAQSRTLGFTEDESRAVTLGELHLRQDNPKEAVEAFKKALARHGLGKIDLPANTSADTAKKIGESVGVVRRKMAQALVAAGEGEEAKKWIDAGDKVFVAHPPAAAKPAGPARLTITVKKKDLDEADALGPETFRKRLTIEATGYPPAKTK